MPRLAVLYTGELIRMRKYGITGASLAAALLWILILELGGFGGLAAIFPFVLFIDVTLMSLLLAGVTMIFETQENALRSLLVTPVGRDEYLLAKSAAVMTSSLTTLGLLLIYGVGIRDLTVHLPGIVGAVMLGAFVFAQVGMVMTYFSRDFTDLLMGMFVFTLVFALPTLFEYVGIIQVEWVRLLQYLNPTKSVLVLIQAAIVPIAAADTAIAFGYLVILGGALYAVSRQLFAGYAAREGGAQ